MDSDTLWESDDASQPLDVEEAFGEHDIEYWVPLNGKLVPASPDQVAMIREQEAIRRLIRWRLLEAEKPEKPEPGLATSRRRRRVWKLPQNIFACIWTLQTRHQINALRPSHLPEKARNLGYTNVVETPHSQDRSAHPHTNS